MSTENPFYNNEIDEDIDFASPMSWGRLTDETDEDYEERIQDQEDLLDYYND